MRTIIMGPPGAGKGTQAKFICSKYSIPHISTGDLLRKEIAEGTPLGMKAKEAMDKGLLVPDYIAMDLIKARLKAEDCRSGYLLDGFPRTLAQASSLTEILEEIDQKIDAVISVEISRDEILKRMVGRRVCVNCGASYHTVNNPPKVQSICDTCGNEIIQRIDDKEDTVKRRLKIYDEQTEPLINYYKEKGILFEVDGSQNINLVSENIAYILGSKVHDNN